MMIRSRIAAVSYLNTIPFIYGIEHAGNSLPAELLLSPPRLCAEALREGKADIALIPVAAIPTIKDINIISNFCIGASSDVRTVLLVSNSPVDQIKRVYLDSHSLTSALLVKIFASEKWKIDPQWVELDDYSVVDSPEPTDGFLLIGDKVFGYEGRFKYVYDFACEWREHTSLPFVFAAWVARKGVDIEVISALNEALNFGVHHIPEAIAKYGYKDSDYAQSYLTENIDFVFDVEKQKALTLFWEKGMKIDPLINPG